MAKAMSATRSSSLLALAAIREASSRCASARLAWMAVDEGSTCSSAARSCAVSYLPHHRRRHGPASRQLKRCGRLKLFLHYARTGRLDLHRKSSCVEDSSVFAQQVAGALREHGFTVHENVGISGCFVNLGVIAPEFAAGTCLAWSVVGSRTRLRALHETGTAYVARFWKGMG